MANSFKGLLIRTGVLVSADLAFVYAGDPRLEEQDVPHTEIRKWKKGVVTAGKAGFTVNTCCRVDRPVFGVLDAGNEGFYSLQTASGVTVGNLFEETTPPEVERFGGIRWVANVDGAAYATGHTGHMLRMDGVRQWTRFDHGIPASFDAEAIHGFSAGELYAVGTKGAIWQYDGRVWQQRESPTNASLTRVKCAGDGVVYVCGHDGIMLRGRHDRWEAVGHEATDAHLWGLEWFAGALYVASMSRLYRLAGDALDAVDFSPAPQPTCYHLTAVETRMWSIGVDDIFAFDGSAWTRIAQT